MFKNGTRVPEIGHSFPKGELRDVALGCGYLSIVDEHGRVYSWGDNYAVRYH
jgi:alpha-tubulin suppressor-like RCC1 family protein